MKRLNMGKKVVVALVCMAAIQAAVLGFRVRHSLASPASWLELGATLSDIQFQVTAGGDPSSSITDITTNQGGTNEPSSDRTLTEDATTVFLVFSSTCPFCAAVAPIWTEWLQGPGAHRHVVAVSAEPFGPAQAWIESQGWDVRVAVVDTTSIEDEAAGEKERARAQLARKFTQRTPWVFVVDPEGVILAQSLGSRIAEITRPRGAP